MIDSDIKAKVEASRQKGKEATEEDFEGEVTDDFLKRLQKCLD